MRDVLLIDASVGFTPNKYLCLLTAAQIDQIIFDVNARQSQGQRCYLVSRDEIAANDYDLNFPRYLFDREKHPVRDLPREAQEITELEQALLALQNQMKQQLATPGCRVLTLWRGCHQGHAPPRELRQRSIAAFLCILSLHPQPRQ